MNKTFSFAALLIFIGLTQACATLSKNDCLGGDWRNIGFRDGSNGYGEDRWNDNVKACSKYGVKYDKNAYLKGREAGIPHYCTSQSGFREGKSGDYYRNVCPPDLEPAFLKGYRLGREIHRLEDRIDSLESDIDRYESQLDDSERGGREKAKIRRSIHQKEREIDRLEDRIDRLESEGIFY